VLPNKLEKSLRKCLVESKDGTSSNYEQQCAIIDGPLCRVTEEVNTWETIIFLQNEYIVDMKLSGSLPDNDFISHNKVSRMAELHFILGQEVFQRLISDVAYK
jgi:hypothetical protein